MRDEEEREMGKGEKKMEWGFGEIQEENWLDLGEKSRRKYTMMEKYERIH